MIADKAPYLIATGNEKCTPLENIPHLIGQKMGKIHPSPRIVYVLFTKADFANKKMRLSAHIKEGGHFMPAPLNY